MRWLIGIGLLAIVVRRLGTERIADVVRWADQRLELFSPRGAGLYARFAPPLLRPLYRLVADEVAALAPETVLDVGTGPGELAIEIAIRCRSSSVIGVDLAPEMLDTAQERGRDAGVGDRVHFEVADAGALPLADASIDVAVSTLSLHHWRDVPAILREFHRVVRPGGRVLIYDLRFSYSPRQFAAFVAQTPFAGREDRVEEAKYAHGRGLALRFSSIRDRLKASWMTRGSICHAGRNLSRKSALRRLRGVDVGGALAREGIVVPAERRDLLAEEASIAYKDVEAVVRSATEAGHIVPIARLRPLAVIKG